MLTMHSNHIQGLGETSGIVKHKNTSTFPGDLEVVDFPDLCKIVHHRIENLEVVGADAQFCLKTAATQLDEKEIMISFLAACNTGKSTILNALLGDSFLPTSQGVETGLNVVIMHDSEIHEGVCLPNCPYSQERKNCPRLEVKMSNALENIFGVKNICEKIRELNKAQRDRNSTSVPELYLKVNIPLLAERIPEGWTVNLVDNPGSGEYIESIARAASQSLETSSAYVILSSTETSGTKMEVDTFQFLHKERDVLKQRNAKRLIVAVTKIDKFYEQDSEMDDSEEILLLDDVQARVCQSIRDATNEQYESDILPVSGKWGLASSKLRNCQITSGTPVASTEEFKEEYERRLKQGQRLVGYTPKFACGQGNMKNELQHMKAEEVIEKLDDASGFNLLNDGLSTMLKTCRKVWATSLFQTYSMLLGECETLCHERVQNLKSEVEDKMKEHDQDLEILDEIRESEQKLITSMKEKETSDVWRKMTMDCKDDIEVSDTKSKACEFCHKKIVAFKDDCKNALQTKKTRYTQDDLETKICDFLKRIENDLQGIFNQSCHFKKLHDTTYISIEASALEIMELCNNAKSLCSVKENIMSKTDICAIRSDETTVDFKAVPDPPNFHEILQAMDIPYVKLASLRKVIESIRNFFRNPEQKAEAASRYTYSKWDDSLDRLFNDLLQSLNDHCDDQVKDISEISSEYFYRVYEETVKKRLENFSDTSTVHLNSKDEELAKLAKNIDDLDNDLDHCSQVEKHMKKLKCSLKTAYDKFVAQPHHWMHVY